MNERGFYDMGMVRSRMGLPDILTREDAAWRIHVLH
jgi:hypothetical protein